METRSRNLILLIALSLPLWADSTELLSGPLQAQLVDLNANSWVVGELCFDGCQTDLWTRPGSPALDAYLLPFALDTVPLDLNDANQVLILSNPDLLGVFEPVDAILSLSAPRGTGACQWNAGGFEGQVGQWCGVNGAFIDPVVISNGFTSTANWSLWSGDGLRSINGHQSIVPCVGDCYDYRVGAEIAGYLVRAHRFAAVEPVPEPATIFLLGLCLLVARKLL